MTSSEAATLTATALPGGEGQGVRARTPALRMEAVEFGYAAGFRFGPVSLSVAAGEMAALLGPNGAGKSTCFRLLAGALRPSAGAVAIGTANVSRLARRELARRLAVVPQDVTIPTGYTVRDVVALGRTAYGRLLSGWSSADRRAMARALALTETEALAARPLGSLSGGERQRVLLAMALAQEPDVLLLDEPTAHLDIHFQVEILDLLTRLHASGGLTLLATLHDLNLASLYFPRLLLLHAGRVVADGPPTTVLRPETLAPVFGPAVTFLTHPERGVPIVVPEPGAPR